MVKQKAIDTASRIYLVFALILLYLPILILIISSFNASPRNKAVWGGFSLEGYGKLLHNDVIMQALGTTLLLAAGAALVSTVLGTMACIGMLGMKKRSRTWLMGLTNIPMLNADIVTGVALMLLFSRFVDLSFWTMLIAHITLIIPYVVLCVQPKVMHMNTSMYEAALDLGASPAYAFWKVVLPELVPGIVAGFMLSFTMSLDDFIITHFTKGAGVDTLSTKIYTEVKKGIKPEMYALSTIIFVTVLVLLILVNKAPTDKQISKKKVK